MRQHLHLPATALVLAALLLLPVGITGAMAEDEEIIVESDEDAIFDPTQVGGLDVMNLGDLVTDPGAVAP